MAKTKLNRKNKANNNASGEAPLVSSVEPPVAGVVQRKIKKKGSWRSCFKTSC